MDKFAICMFFLAGALTVFVLCESKPRSGLPSWLANPLEVASAVRTLTIHRGLVQQFEAWVGMPILMFGAAVPAVTVMSIFGWASPDVLRRCMPCIFSGAMNQEAPARSCLRHRSLQKQISPQCFVYKHFDDPCELMFQVPARYPHQML